MHICMYIYWASFPGSSAGKESAWRPGFDSWVGKILWRKEWVPTPVFWPGEFHGLYSPWGCKELHTTEQLSHTHVYINVCVYIHLYPFLHTWQHPRLTFFPLSALHKIYIRAQPT